MACKYSFDGGNTYISEEKFIEELANGKLEEFINDKVIDISKLRGGKKPPVEPPTSSTTEGDLEGDNGKGQRRFTKRLMETEGLLPKSEISKTLNYTKQQNSLSISEANKLIDEVGLDEAFNFAKDAEMNGAVRTVIGQTLISRYNNLIKLAKEEDKPYYLDKTIEVAKYVTEKLATDAGQMIQAFSLWNKLSPEAQFRNAQQDLEKQGDIAKKKAEKDINKITKKLLKVNEETAEQIVSETLESNAKQKLKKIQDKRKSIKDKYKGKGGITLTSGGLTPEGIEFFGEMAKTYIEEGIVKIEIIVENLIKDFKEVTGKEPNEDIVNKIKEISNKRLDKEDIKLIGKGLKDLNIKIKDIVKKHYTEVDKIKTTLAEKLIEEAGLTGAEANELSIKIEEAFDRVATRKKEKILNDEIKRLEKAKNKLKGTKKVENKQLHEEIIKLTNLGGFDNNQVLELLAQKIGTGKLTLEEAKKIQELSERVQKAPEGSPKNDATQDLLSYQANLKGVTKSELAQALWYANLLSGYKTQQKNFLSNLFTTFSLLGTEIFRSPTSTPFIVKGLIDGWYRGIIEARHTLVTGKSPIHVEKIETPNTLERKGFIGGKFNPFNWFKFVNRAMVAADVISFQGLREARSNQLAFSIAAKNGGKNLFSKQYWDVRNPFDKKVWKNVNDILLNTDERKQESIEIYREEQYNNALENGFIGSKSDWLKSLKNKPEETIEGKRRVFELMEQSRPIEFLEDTYNFAARGTYNYQPEGLLGALNNTLSTFLNIPISGARPLRFIVPFTRILTNVANEALNYDPIFGTFTAVRGKVGFESFDSFSPTKGTYKVLTPEERKTQFVKAGIGIATLSMFYALSKMRNDDDEPLIEVTGAGTSDFNKMKQLSQSGWKPFSIKIGDSYYSYSLTPLVFPLSYIGNLNDYEKYTKPDDDSVINKINMTAHGFSRLLADMTWMNSLSEFLDIFYNDDKSGSKALKWIENQSKSAVPFLQFFSQISQKFQDIFEISEKETSQWGSNIIKDIPIARDVLFNKINVLGEEITKDTYLLTSDIKKGKEWDYITKNNIFILPPSKKTIIWDDKENIERPLNAEEFYNYSLERGKRIKELIRNIIDYGRNIVENDKSTYKTSSELSKNKKELQKIISKEVAKITEDVKKDMFAKPKESLKQKVAEKISNTRNILLQRKK